MASASSINKVRPGQKDTYGQLKLLKKRYGETEPMDMDHQPSFAAQLKAAEQKRGKKLDDAERKWLKHNTHAVASHRDVHRQTSLTFGGRNTPQMIENDSTNLNAAGSRDWAAWIQAMTNRGYTQMKDGKWIPPRRA
jgi:hypothetical protein